MTSQAARATVLFRTLLHEIGHYVDWLRHIVWPCPDVEVSEERREQLYFSRSHTVREDFAHRYATETFNRLKEEGKLPFEQLSSVLSDCEHEFDNFVARTTTEYSPELNGIISDEDLAFDREATA